MGIAALFRDRTRLAQVFANILHNAAKYTEPGGYDKLRTEGHLEVYGNYLCTSNPVPGTPEPNEYLSTELGGPTGLLDKFAFGGAKYISL